MNSKPDQNQLSLFLALLTDTDNNERVREQSEAEETDAQDYPTIRLVSTCQYCKSTHHIAPHTAIHPVDWMRKHWKEIEPLVFETAKSYCSRQCEIGAQKAAKRAC